MQKSKKSALLQRVLQFIKSLPTTVVAFCSWWLFLFAFISVLNWIDIEHYQPDDVPNERFDVLSIDEHGNQLPKRWGAVKDNPQLWVGETDNICHAEDCLFTEDDGSVIFYNDGALWNTQSHYRIEDNKLIPISFLFFTIGTVFNAMILASLIYAIGKYGMKRWLYRHSVEKTQVYKQEVRQQVKTFLIWLGALIGFYVVMSMLQK